MYTEIHEIFFCSFLVELYEWIVKLADGQGRWRLDNLIVWTPGLVRMLEAFEDNIMRAIDHRLNHIIGGFVRMFGVNTSISYNEAKRRFFKGLRGKYLKSLNTRINILLCEQWVIRLP